MVAMNCGVGHIAEIPAPLVIGVIPNRGMVMESNYVLLTMIVNAHLNHVTTFVLYRLGMNKIIEYFSLSIRLHHPMDCPLRT